MHCKAKIFLKCLSRSYKKYTGPFDLDSIAYSVTIFMKNNTLFVRAPGQGELELIPIAPDTFTIKNISGYTIYFKMEEGKVAGFTSVQPNGTFKAHIKK